jgi:hypothetical protein
MFSVWQNFVRNKGFFSVAFFVIFVFLLTPLSSVLAISGVPQIMSYQGRLANSAGDLVGGSGAIYSFKFSLWDSATVGGGNQVWPAALPTAFNATVRQGLFNVNIGDTANGYPDTLDYDFSLNNKIYLQTEVSSDGFTYETLGPRQPITSAPFAQVAASVYGSGVSTMGGLVVNGDSTTTNATTTGAGYFGSAIGLAGQYINQWSDLSAYLPTVTGWGTSSDAANWNILFASSTSDGLAEGSINKYYSDLKVGTYLDLKDKSYFFSSSSADIWGADKGYLTSISGLETDPLYTAASSSLLRYGTTSDALTEGLVNKFYTQAKVWTDIIASSTFQTFANYWTETGSDLSYLSGKVSVGTTSTSSTFNIQAAPGVSPFIISSSTGATMLTLSSNGNLAIGGARTNSPLQIYNATAGTKFIKIGNVIDPSTTANAAGIVVDVNGGGGVFMGDSTNGLYGKYEAFGGKIGIGAMSNHPLGLYANNTERISITAAGLVGLSTTTPNANLNIFGTTNTFLRVASSTNQSIFVIDNNGNASLSGSLTLDGLNGPLQAVNGLISATSSIGSSYLASNVMLEGENISLLNNNAGYLTSFTELDPYYAAASSSLLRYGTTSDALTEGLVNKFYTQAKVWTDVAASSTLTTLFANAATAFSWGNHALAGYLTSELDPVWSLASTTVAYLAGNNTFTGLNTFENATTTFGSGTDTFNVSNITALGGAFTGKELSGTTNLGANIFSIKNGIYLRGEDGNPAITFGTADFSTTSAITYNASTDQIDFENSEITTPTGNSIDWAQAFNWGNHALAGYLTSYTESDPFYSAASSSLLRYGTTSDALTEGLVNKFYTQAKVWDDIVASSTFQTFANYWTKIGNDLNYLAGNVAVGTSTFDSTNPEKFLIDAGNTSSVNGLVVRGNINNYFQMNVKNSSAGANASADVVATNDTGSESTGFINMGINSSGYSGGIVGLANDTYLYGSSTGNMLVGNASAGKNLIFFTNGANGYTNEKMRISSSGFVGIGNTNPTQALEVGTTTAGLNGIFNATLGAELTPSFDAGNWTGTNGWSATGSTLEKVTNATAGTITPSGAGATPVIGTTYKITITTSAKGAAAVTYTYGGITGTTIVVGTFTDYITAATAGKLIITGAISSTATITGVSIKALSDNTGDLYVYGDLKLASRLTNPSGTLGLEISPTGAARFGSTLTVASTITGGGGLVVAGTVTGVTSLAHSLAITGTVPTLYVSTDGYALTAAASTGVTSTLVPLSISPRIRQTGQAWDIDSAANVLDNYWSEVISYPGTTTVNSKLAWYYGQGAMATAAEYQAPEIMNYYNGSLNVLGSTYSSEVLANGALTSGTSWTQANGFSLSSNTAVYVHSASGGTLTQASSAFSVPVKANRWYRFTWTSSALNTTARAYIDPTGISQERVYLRGTVVSAGTYTTTFKTNSNPGNFIITADSAASGDGFTLDNLSLVEVNSGNIAANGLFTGGGTEGLKIDNMGLVGIGTSTPDSELNIFGTNTNFLRVSSSTNQSIFVVDANGNTSLSGSLTLGNLNGLLFGTNGLVSFVSTSTLNLATSSFASGNISQWVNDINYLAFGTTSDALTEGATNKFYTQAKVWNDIIASTTFPTFSNYWTKTGNDLSYLAGNIGIGTTTGTSMLNVQGTSGVSALNISSSTGASMLTVASNGNVGIGTTTPIQTLDVFGNIKLGTSTGGKLTTSGSELTLEQTGDSLGTTRLRLQSRSGMSGALFENANIDLVDFGFLTSSGAQQTIRFEHRGSNILSGNTSGQFEIGPANTLTTNLIVGSAVSAFRVGNIGIGTTTPNANLNIFGTTNTLFRVSSSTNQNIFVIDGNGNIATNGDLTVSKNSNLATTTMAFGSLVGSLAQGYMSVEDYDLGTIPAGTDLGDGPIPSDIINRAPLIKFSSPNLGIDATGRTGGISNALSIYEDSSLDSNPKINFIANDFLTGLTFNIATIEYSTTSKNMVFTTEHFGLNTETTHLLELNGGAYSDGPTWENSSDRTKKENFTPLDPNEILNKINQLPITQWNYISQSATTTHIGPMAQDFYALFGLGGSDTSISTVDPAGVALVGIQALDKKIKEIEENIKIISAGGSLEGLIDPNLIAVSSSSLSIATTTTELSTSTAFSILSDRLLSGVGTVKELISERMVAMVGLFDYVKAKLVETDTLRVEKGMEIKDAITGDIYCVVIASGDWVKTKGRCSNLPEANNPTPVDVSSPIIPPVITETSSSTLPSLDTSSTTVEIVDEIDPVVPPEPAPIVEPAPEPVIESAPAPEPSPAPVEAPSE